MNIFLVVALAFALAMDAFAVAVGISASLKTMTVVQTMRLALFFGLFQFAMPILGWLFGKSIIGYIQAIDHWVAFGLLVLIGLRMIYASVQKGETIAKQGYDPTTGLSLLLLSLATSIDALTVGVSFATLRMAIMLPALVIGIVAFLMSTIGTKIGPVLGKNIGRRAELVGGVVLIFIGCKILADHLA